MSKPKILEISDKLKGTILYEDETGTKEEITLSETSANFDYIDIIFRATNGTISEFSSVRIYSPNSKKVYLCSGYFADSHTAWQYFVEKNINGVNITNGNYGGWSNVWGTNGMTFDLVNKIYITKIVGYKFTD